MLNEIEMNSFTTLNDFSFARFDVHMAIWLTNSSWSCFKFSIEMENDEFKINSITNVSSIILCISKKIVHVSSTIAI
jgi:hypothetical protein